MFNKNLSLKLDEVHALLNVAISPELIAVLRARKRNIEELIFQQTDEIQDVQRVDARTWERLRERRLELDDYRCQGCGRNDVIFNVHHIVPLYRGGSNELENLTTLCQDCHEKIHPWMQAKDSWTLLNSN